MLCKSSFPANYSSCNSQLPYKEYNDWGKIIVGKILFWGLPGGTSGKESTCQSRRCKRCRFDPWVGKIPWRRKWLPTPVFLPGESHAQKSLVGHSLWGCKELDMTERLIHTHPNTHPHIIREKLIGMLCKVFLITKKLKLLHIANRFSLIQKRYIRRTPQKSIWPKSTPLFQSALENISRAIAK